MQASPQYYTPAHAAHAIKAQEEDEAELAAKTASSLLRTVRNTLSLHVARCVGVSHDTTTAGLELAGPFVRSFCHKSGLCQNAWLLHSYKVQGATSPSVLPAITSCTLLPSATSPATASTNNNDVPRTGSSKSSKSVSTLINHETKKLPA
jgi:hypothetical protein